MSFWSAVVAIVAIIAFARVRMNRENRDYQDQPPVDTAYTAALEREVAEMRKRLEVLERIATDDGETRRLSREIESLREK